MIAPKWSLLRPKQHESGTPDVKNGTCARSEFCFIYGGLTIISAMQKTHINYAILRLAQRIGEP
jgi:hypothetical protein